MRRNEFKYAINVTMLIFLLASFSLVSSTPIGPIVTLVKNETRSPDAAAMINTSGGSITTMVFNATAQNQRWKAYVGNVSGTLTLDDANNYSIYNWDLGTVTGEVYATRSSSTVSWDNLNCSNTTQISDEEIALNHVSNPNDNISTTFNSINHSEFYVSTNLIPQNTCYSIHTFVNDTSQDNDFEEIIMYDGTSTVYTTILESNVNGFNNEQYDFQMIVPENGLATWSSSTPYYFYVELT